MSQQAAFENAARRFQDRIASVNAALSSLLGDARDSLSGRREFTIETVRAIAALVSEMAPILPRAKEFRSTQPEIASYLDIYVALAGELHGVLENVRIMLVARRAAVESGREQLRAVSQWAATFQQTR